MKIIFIRHADPDYPNNTLTEKGFIEADALGEYYKDFHYDQLYISPLNRAVLTAKAFSKYHENKGEIKDFLQEFNHPVKYPYKDLQNYPWDIMPSYYASDDDFYSNEKWSNQKEMKKWKIKKYYDSVCKQFDEILKNNGYKRKGRLYKVTNENEKVLVFVCHFGLMSVLVSHLYNLSFPIMSTVMCCLPTGVTEFASEERQKGIAQFRMLRYGDLSHLAVAKIEPSFAARFCETYSSKNRH